MRLREILVVLVALHHNQQLGGTMSLSPESAAIMARLAAVGVPAVLGKMPRQPRGSRNKMTVDTVGSRRGRLSPKTTDRRSMNYGRRRMSPYQARAMSSGEGVLPAKDIVYTSSPQDWPAGWTTSHWTSTGHSTIQDN